MQITEKNTVKRYNMMIGLKDKDSKKPAWDGIEVLRNVTTICKNLGLCFSNSFQKGGYFHDDGTFIQEFSLYLSFINAEENLINQLAEILCARFNQESILITVDDVDCYSITQ